MNESQVKDHWLTWDNLIMLALELVCCEGVDQRARDLAKEIVYTHANLTGVNGKLTEGELCKHGCK